MAILEQNETNYVLELGWYGKCPDESCANFPLIPHQDKIVKAFQFSNGTVVKNFEAGNPTPLQDFTELECGHAYLFVLNPGQGSVLVDNLTLSTYEAGDYGRMVDQCTPLTPTPTPVETPTPTPEQTSTPTPIETPTPVETPTPTPLEPCCPEDFMNVRTSGPRAGQGTMTLEHWKFILTGEATQTALFSYKGFDAEGELCFDITDSPADVTPNMFEDTQVAMLDGIAVGTVKKYYPEGSATMYYLHPGGTRYIGEYGNAIYTTQSAEDQVATNFVSSGSCIERTPTPVPIETPTPTPSPNCNCIPTDYNFVTTITNFAFHEAGLHNFLAFDVGDVVGLDANQLLNSGMGDSLTLRLPNSTDDHIIQLSELAITSSGCTIYWKHADLCYSGVASSNNAQTGGMYIVNMTHIPLEGCDPTTTPIPAECCGGFDQTMDIVNGSGPGQNMVGVTSSHDGKVCWNSTSGSSATISYNCQFEVANWSKGGFSFMVSANLNADRKVRFETSEGVCYEGELVNSGSTGVNIFNIV